MGRWDGWVRLWSRISGRGRKREVEDELRFHLESRIREYERQGLSREEAVARARERFGDVDRVERQLQMGVDRRVRRSALRERLSVLLQDLRVTVRQLRNHPTYTLIAVATLTLGIGTNTAIFTVVSGYLLTPLPYESPDRIVAIRELQAGDLGEMTVAPANYFIWKEEASTLQAAAAFNIAAPTITGDGDPERVVGSVVTSNFFDLLGVAPARGPGFSPDHGREGREAVVLSHGLWQRRFGSDPGIVGSSIVLDGAPHEVVGVMPPDFKQPEHSTSFQDPELWEAISLEGQRSATSHYLRVIGRMAPGASLAAVAEEAAALGREVEARHPDSHEGWGTVVRPLEDQLMAQTRPTLYMLLGAGGIILLIVCANMANLVLARTQDRSREFALRAALGAGRIQLARGVMLESVVVALAGGVLGAGLVWLGQGAIEQVQDRYLTRLVDVGIDGTVLALTVGAALATALVFGLLPALRSARPDLRSALVEGTSGGGMSLKTHRMRQLLVTGEVALTAALLVGAGLMIRSVLALSSVPPGFEVSDMLIFRVSAPSARYETGEERNAFYDNLRERLQGLPGVSRVGSASDLLFTGENVLTTYAVAGRQYEPGSAPRAEMRAVDQGYFRALGIPVQAGRTFSGDESPDDPPTVVVNRAFADAVWPGEDPLGKRMDIHNGGVVGATVIGVVGNVLDDGLAARPDPLLYLPFSHRATSRRYWLLGTTAEPGGLAPQVRRLVAELDPLMPVSEVRTLEELVAESAAPSRAASRLGLALAVLALTLAAVGIYGVLSYLVSSRIREMGIRTALGARRTEVVSLIMGHSLRVAAAGLVLGMGVALIVGRLLSGLLFGVSPTDPLTLVGASVVLLATAVLAAWHPARRASRVDPVVALRAE